MTGQPSLRYQSLDVLRGVASLTVVIFHYKHFFFKPGEFGNDVADPGFNAADLPFFDSMRFAYVDG